MADLDLFRKEVYEKLGQILEEKGDEGFISEGPKLVADFYSKYPEFFDNLETLHAVDRYTRKKIICDNGKHAVRCMEWAPDSESPIHEHGGRPCFDIVLSGELDIIDFNPEKITDSENEYELKEVKRYGVKVGEFVIVDPQKTGNELHEVFCKNGRSKSLHFYPIDHKSFGVYENLRNGRFRRSEHEAADD